MSPKGLYRFGHFVTRLSPHRPVVNATILLRLKDVLVYNASFFAPTSDGTVNPSYRPLVLRDVVGTEPNPIDTDGLRACP